MKKQKERKNENCKKNNKENNMSNKGHQNRNQIWKLTEIKRDQISIRSKSPNTIESKNSHKTIIIKMTKAMN